MKELTLNCIDWTKNFLKRTNGRKIVVGVSGGKDSSAMLGVSVAAVGKDNVIGVMMPNGIQSDIEDSKKIIDHLGVKGIEINIGYAVQNLANQISNSSLASQAIINMPARVRMTTLYGVAQNIGGRVANTCNLSEDIVGYATLYGDSAGDFSPFGLLTTEEVIEIGDDLGLPYELMHKTPSDGLCGKSDEDNLGFTYKEINELIRKNIHGPHYEEIMDKYRKNIFKTEIIQIPKFNPGYFNSFIDKSPE
jgi:NAD+ synthase